MTTSVLCVLVVTCAVVLCEDGLDSKVAEVRDLFREMLHIKPPTEGAGRPPHLEAPRHMLELYQQYSNQRPSENAPTTIRNILPTIGVVGGKEVLLFNMSSVQQNEEVQLAQLQLNRRRLSQRHHHKRLLAPPYRVKLARATPGRLMTLASVPVTAASRSAWGVVDVTTAIKELLLDPRRHLLAVRFESPGGKSIMPSTFLRGVPDTCAFLVLFSEDTEEHEVTEEGIRPPPRQPVHTHALVQKLHLSQHGLLLKDQEENTPPMIPHIPQVKERRFVRRNYTTPTPTMRRSLEGAETSNHLHTSGERLRRKMRSIIDNQLPDDDDLLNVQGMKSPPGSLLAEKTHILRLPENSDRKHKKGKKSKRTKGKKQKFLSSLDSWQNVYQNPDTTPGACTVRKMTVNFAELGWGEWIISPDKFEANYCTGSCRFPLTKALKPSNHATLQSLVHALGHHPLVPAPACVPHQMSAITLLYFDETLSVVIKNYPSMVVESCACR